MDFYERACGARMHAMYIRPGGVSFDLSLDLLEDIFLFVEQFSHRIDEIEDLLTNNRIWISRLTGVGVVDVPSVNAFGFTGVMARGSGLFMDLRVNHKYSGYGLFNFSVPVGIFGDCFDRYLIRVSEMRQSLFIMYQALLYLLRCNFIGEDRFTSKFKGNPPSRAFMKYSMESLISHFKLYSQGTPILKEEVYSVIEAPKGEFGVFLFSDNTSYLDRCRVKAPGFLHLQGLNFMSKGLFLADLVTIIGTQDIVFGEIDR